MSKPKYKFTRAKWYEAVYNYNYYHEVEGVISSLEKGSKP